MDTKEEIRTMFNQIWIKLQSLPRADPYEFAGFSILLIFVLTFLGLAVIACAQCCCSCGGSRRNKDSVI